MRAPHTSSAYSVQPHLVSELGEIHVPALLPLEHQRAADAQSANDTDAIGGLNRKQAENGAVLSTQQQLSQDQ